jgi:hypothetical protein
VLGVKHFSLYFCDCLCAVKRAGGFGVNSVKACSKFLYQNLGAFFAANAAKNRAFRFKSSEAPMRFLRAFRFNPLRRAAAAQNRFAILPPGQDARAGRPGFYQILNRL